ncbi:MAG: cytochrome P450 [Chloroflexi bacterium]|nr:cytochrome P450 [Chloroflexota bacterium]
MSQKKLPGPGLWFLLRNGRQLSADPLAAFELLAQYGDMVLLALGPRRMVFINHPDLVREVMVTKAAQFQKSKLLKRVFEDSVGNNVFTGDGDFWKRQRHLMQPAFHTRRIGAYANIMVSHARQLVDGWRDGQTLSVSREMMHLTMGIVTKALFDADLRDDSAGAAFSRLFEVVGHRIARQNSVRLPYWLPTRENRAVRQSVAAIDRVLQPIIEERRQSGRDTGDLLSMLVMASEGGGMSDDQLRNEVMTLFGAGYETTANTLTWTFYLLSQHPEVEAKLLDEIDRVLPTGRPVTLDDLARLPYTEMVIKEAMRCYPTSVAISRDAVEDVEIGGYVIPRGTMVVLSQWTLHHDPRFCDEPARFRPERFSVENEANIDRYAYLPFGVGPRICLGNAFAMMEARLALATILQHYRLTPAPGYIMHPDFRFTLRPSGGLPMVARRRKIENSSSSP